MSKTLLEFAKSFVHGRLSARVFSEAYVELWKIERDQGFPALDGPLVDECLSSIFCASDMYSPLDSRKDYEFNEEKLALEVSRLLLLVDLSD